MNLKRLLDFILALIFIILLAIPILIISLIICLTTKGPAFYWSKRVGKDNKIFNMPKFRTMRVDTPQLATHLLSNADKWITPVGKFLRAHSIDEFPQLFNIVLGNMSFVGPRPALFNQEDLVALRTKKGIDKLTPGLTGWAQVNGRDELSVTEKVEPPAPLYHLTETTSVFPLVKKKPGLLSLVGIHLKKQPAFADHRKRMQVSLHNLFLERQPLESAGTAVISKDDHLRLRHAIKDLDDRLLQRIHACGEKLEHKTVFVAVRNETRKIVSFAVDQPATAALLSQAVSQGERILNAILDQFPVDRPSLPGEQSHCDETARIDVSDAQKGLFHVVKFNDSAGRIILRTLQQFIRKYPEMTGEKPLRSFQMDFQQGVQQKIPFPFMITKSPKLR